MVPTCMLGSLTAIITLDGPLPPLYCFPADHTGVLGAIGPRVNNSAGVTTEEEQKKDCPPGVCVIVRVVVWCGFPQC